MTELDLKDGKIFLNKITEKIRTRLTEVDASIEAGQKDIQSMNEYYWENYTEMDEYGYENYDNQQALLHQVNDNQEKQKMRHRLRKMLEAPFFGRVDFIFDGVEEPEIFYIGIGGTILYAGQMEHIVKEAGSTIPLILENAADFNWVGNPHFGKDSIVAIASISGDTKEVVEAALDFEKCPYEAEVSLVLTTDEEIRKTNEFLNTLRELRKNLQ